jgi:hypothetical protein
MHNPLAAIVSAVNIPGRSPHNPASVEQAQALIRRRLEWILRLVEGLQDITCIATGRLAMCTERVDLIGLVRQLWIGSHPLGNFSAVSRSYCKLALASRRRSIVAPHGYEQSARRVTPVRLAARIDKTGGSS